MEHKKQWADETMNEKKQAETEEAMTGSDSKENAIRDNKGATEPRR